MIFERGMYYLFEHSSAKIKQHTISAAPAVRDDECGMSHPNAIQCWVLAPVESQQARLYHVQSP